MLLHLKQVNGEALFDACGSCSLLSDMTSGGDSEDVQWRLRMHVSQISL